MNIFQFALESPSAGTGEYRECYTATTRCSLKRIALQWLYEQARRPH